MNQRAVVTKFYVKHPSDADSKKYIPQIAPGFTEFPYVVRAWAQSDPSVTSPEPTFVLGPANGRSQPKGRSNEALPDLESIDQAGRGLQHRGLEGALAHYRQPEFFSIRTVCCIDIG